MSGGTHTITLTLMRADDPCVIFMRRDACGDADSSSGSVIPPPWRALSLSVWLGLPLPSPHTPLHGLGLQWAVSAEEGSPCVSRRSRPSCTGKTLQLLAVSDLGWFSYQRCSPPFSPAHGVCFFGNRAELGHGGSSGKQCLFPQPPFSVAKP